MKNLAGDNQTPTRPSSSSLSDVRKQVCSSEERLNTENVDAESTRASKASTDESSDLINKGIETETAKECENKIAPTSNSNNSMTDTSDTIKKNARKSEEISNFTGDDEHEGSGSENFQ